MQSKRVPTHAHSHTNTHMSTHNPLCQFNLATLLTQNKKAPWKVLTFTSGGSPRARRSLTSTFMCSVPRSLASPEFGLNRAGVFWVFFSMGGFEFDELWRPGKLSASATRDYTPLLEPQTLHRVPSHVWPLVLCAPLTAWTKLPHGASKLRVLGSERGTGPVFHSSGKHKKTGRIKYQERCTALQLK